jgi:D-glycero-alpha-D-manno-heptose-7-phosphate kinase
MIISSTPLRVSFIGGGTDLPQISDRFGGRVLSASINKYVYVLATKRFDEKIVVGYSQQEVVDEVQQIKHDLVRECASLVGLENGFEIKTMSDIPSIGSGLGSSSAITVGLLNAMHTLKGEQVSHEKLADEACYIEMDVLHNPIGKQDQYACAYGGFNALYFPFGGGTVSVSPKGKLENNGYVLIPTNIPREASTILEEQTNHIEEHTEDYIELRDLTYAWPKFHLHELMQTGWDIKKRLSPSITNDGIDEFISTLRSMGGQYSKLVGAGGGGHILAWSFNLNQFMYNMREANIKYLPFEFENHGSTIIFNLREN